MIDPYAWLYRWMFWTLVLGMAISIGAALGLIATEVIAWVGSAYA